MRQYIARMVCGVMMVAAAIGSSSGQELIRDEQTETICPGDNFIWRGHAYKESYRYVEIEKDIHGVDSVEHILNLTVRYIPETRITRTICAGGSYTFGDRTLTESGIYTYTFHETGCDSVVQLSLNVIDEDTIKHVHHLMEGEQYVWHDSTYSETGVAYFTSTNRFGCDSTEMLILTVNHVDTIDTVAIICPGETFEWHGIRASQSGTFTNAEHQPSGAFNYYRLHLTVRELAIVDTTFTICSDETVSFQGKTYSQPGHYYDKGSCDTLYHLNIRQIPSLLYETRASLSANDSYTWTYWENGTEQTRVFTAPGTYEYENFNEETGCADIWRLILTKDETSYHFVEKETICEGEAYSWHGRDNLSAQIGTTHYFDYYTTRAGQDSIYELVLTVRPRKYSVRQVVFCGETSWKGVRYDHSFVAYDTISSSLGCDSVIRINFDKASSFFSHDTATIVQGETLEWHGIYINTDGLYRDQHVNQYGCDSIYEIGVGVIAAPPQTNLYTTQFTICEGEVYKWRGKEYMTGGTYVDTVYKAGLNEIDSIFSLKLTVRDNYKDTVVNHLYTCGPGAFIRYQGQDYYEDTTIILNLQTIYGCDSIVKTYLHFNTALYLSDTVKIASTELPYLWTYRLADIETDTLLTGAGTYNHVTKAEGSCYNREQLVLIVYPTYLFEQDTTICETDLPFFWLKGPIEHQSDPLQHAIGTTMPYEYRYTTVNGTDSIYRLRLTISEQPKRVVHYHICEGENLRINGINYNDAEYLPGQVYRDTTYRSSTEENVCDSMIITEVEKQAVTRHYETKILDYDQSLPYIWHEKEVNQLGLTPDTIESSDPNECYQIEFLNLVQERRDFLTLCQLDTATNPEAFVWHEYDLKNATSGIFHDTVFDATGMITDFFTLELTMNAPVDTMIFLRGCMPEGVTFNDKTYFNDTILRDTLMSCDTIYTLHIQVGKNYSISIVDTICEHELPYILGRQDPQEIWAEGVYPHNDTTALGCDSTITLTLRIIPSLPKSDSTFLCEDEIKQHPVVLGNLVNPTFALGNGGQYEGAWEGKWQGVSYHNDTIVYNCDSSYFHHIIVRPSQKMVKDTTLYLCPGDTLQLFYPRDDSTWFYKDTVYEEHVPMVSTWTDAFHHYTYANDAYSCDSITRWHIKVLPLEQGKEEKHILLGDSTWWGGAWRYYTGVYDSIAPAKDTSSFGDTCTYIRQLYLYVDTAYYYRDTIDLCTKKNQSLMHTWFDGHQQSFTVGSFDMEARHYTDSLITYDRRDSIYDLCVNYRIIRDTMLFDTICPGDSIQFDRHYIRENANTTVEQYIHTAGIYRDTVTAVNGCDSIITLYLYVRDRIVTIPKIVDIADTAIPYLWEHHWTGADGQPKDSTQKLYTTGEYSFPMESVHGCDSIDSLVLRVHKTYNIQEDTLYICHDQTPYTWQDRNDIINSGDYAFHTLTFDGYDSTRYIRIEVLPIMRKLVIDTICEGDSLRFGLTKMNQPRFLKKIGVYYDTLTSHQHGCDSIIELRLNVYPTYRKHKLVDISDQELPYTWEHIQGGQVIGTEMLNGSGEYAYYFTTSFGCDSVDSLSLRVHQTYRIKDDTIRICSDQTPYTWHDHNNIAASGEYTYFGQTHDGYDSIHTVYIEVSPVKYTTIPVAICEGSSYMFRGQALTAQGNYYDTLTTANGCDSIVTLVLTVDKPYFHNRTEHIIEGNSVEFFGVSYSKSGTYTHYGVTPTGCDSTSVLQLVVHPLVDTTVVVCSTDLPYSWVNKWNGQVTPLYAAGIYRNDTTYVGSERMFYGLQLIVNQPTNTTIYHEICEGDTYNFNGRDLTVAGEYRDTIRNVNGCDSVMILHLNVLKKYYNFVDRSIYEGDTVKFQGQVYSTSGAYPVRYTSSFGCDSIIELRLTVMRLYDDSISVCANALPYLWRGQTIYESGIYRDTVYDTNNKPSVTGLKVTILPFVHKEEVLQFSMCEGDFYKFGDSILTKQGIYYDTLTAANGCDSIVMLSLTVHPTNYYSDVRRIFEGDSALFNGVWYKESGVYEYRLTNANGCTDTYQMILTVLKSSYTDTTAVVCDKDLPFVWRGYEYNESGDYSLPIAWTDSSRVVKTLHLTVYHTYYGERNIAICAGDTFLFRGKKYFESGELYDTIPSLNGCDSIIKYVISVHPTFDKLFEKHISDKEPFNFHGRSLSQTGNYEWTGKTVNGCDSVEHLNLIVHPSFFQSDTLHICQSDDNYPYVWQDENGRIIGTYSESGIYNDSVLTAYGFDSVHQIVLYVHPSYLINEQYEIGEGEHLKIHGLDISTTGVYYNDLLSIHGCDSIYHIVVNKKRTREFYRTAEICQGDYYEFFGRKLTHTGNYTYTSQYKDSIVYLSLTTKPVSISEKRIVITDKQLPYIYDGRLYDAMGVYSDTLVNMHGCDSVKRLVLVVTQRYSEWDPMPLCPGSEVKIDGKVITEAGLYTFERRSRVTGEMDSLYRVEVYDAPAFDFPAETRTICEGDTFYYAGKAHTRAGHYDYRLKTINGCDSILHLDLTVNPSYHFITDSTIADYQSVLWRGRTYFEEGDYDRTWPTIKDCDSTYTLSLKVVETRRDTATVTICSGQSYTWRGKTFENDGFYVDTIWQPESRFSAIYALRLIVAYPTNIVSARTGDICADADGFDIFFEYSGQKPTHYSVYFDALAKREGFEDIINEPLYGEMVAHIQLPKFSSIAYETHPYYVRPDYYTLHIALDNGVCGISRSDSIELLIKYPSWIIEQNWMDVVAPLKSEYNGGFEFANTEWFINGVQQTQATAGYLYSTELIKGDQVVMKATRKGENYSVPTCPLIISDPVTTANDVPVIVNPTQAPKTRPIFKVTAPKDGRYEVYSATGTIIQKGTLHAGETELTLPSTSGIYFIRTQQGDESASHKVLIF